MNNAHTSLSKNDTPCGSTRRAVLAVMAVAAAAGWLVVMMWRKPAPAPPAVDATPDAPAPVAVPSAVLRAPQAHTPQPQHTASGLTAQLVEGVRVFRENLALPTNRFDRLSGAQAAELLAATPDLAGRLQWARHISSSCRDYTVGAWFLSNVFQHALNAGSVTDIFFAGWYWGDFCAAHHEYDSAIAVYEDVLARIGADETLSPNSRMLILNNLAITLGMAQYTAREETAAQHLYDFLMLHHAELTAGSAAFGFNTCLTMLYNRHKFDEARSCIATVRKRFPHLFAMPHSPLRMLEDSLRNTDDNEAHISLSLGDLRPETANP